MTTPDETRMARLEAQVIDLTELVQTLGGRCMALEIAVADATLQIDVSSATAGASTTSELLDRVYASLLATHVASQFLAGFQETAQGISEARDIVDTIEGRYPEAAE